METIKALVSCVAIKPGFTGNSRGDAFKVKQYCGRGGARILRRRHNQPTLSYLKKRLGAPAGSRVTGIPCGKI